MIVTAIKLTHCFGKYLYLCTIFFFSIKLTIYKDVSTDKKPQKLGHRIPVFLLPSYPSSDHEFNNIKQFLNLLFVLNVVASACEFTCSYLY